MSRIKNKKIIIKILCTLVLLSMLLAVLLPVIVRGAGTGTASPKNTGKGLVVTEFTVENASFEEWSRGLPTGYGLYDWKSRKGVTEYIFDTKEKVSGQGSLLIKSNFPNDARVKKRFKVKPETYYRITCWVKTKDIGKEYLGANISVDELGDTSKDLRGTYSTWQKLEFIGITGTGQKSLVVTLGLGGYSNLNTGMAWFDDLKVEELDGLPAGKRKISFFTELSAPLSWLKDGTNTGIAFWFVIVFAIFFIAFAGLTIKLNCMRYGKKGRFGAPESGVGGEANELPDTVRVKPFKLTKKDIIIMTVITIVYLAIALYKLGSVKVPETYWSPIRMGESITFDFGREVNLSRIYYYPGLGDGEYHLEYIDPSTGEYTNIMDITKDQFDDCFIWKYKELDLKTDHIKLVADTYAQLFEIGFFEKDSDTPISGVKIFAADTEELDDGKPEYLIDESDTVHYIPNFMTCTYFDEIYHARTAYEHIEGISPYETTHPPLGKVLMAGGILLFGMNPFGWRFIGMMIGVLMIPAMYAFGMKVFKQRFYAFCVAFLMMFDFMHFTQTRIATIDSYCVLFTIAMYYYMYDYYMSGSYRLGFKKSMKALFLSGLFFGIGAASKWICLYAGAGLAVIFFLAKYKEYREYIKWYKSGEPPSEKWHRDYVPYYLNLTIIMCVVFFIVIPTLVYIASYVPYIKVPGSSLNTVWENQLYMYKYHAKDVLDAEHGFASPWWSWPLLIRPMWFYEMGGLPEGLTSTIVTMGNPAIWWTGLITLISSIVISIKRRDKSMVPVFVAYFTQLLPWVFIERVVFIYHYFSAVPFLIITIVYIIRAMLESQKKWAKYVVAAYLAVVVLLFIMYYPAISGITTSRWYVDNVLRILPGWDF